MTIRWKRPLDAHHDVELLPDGRMLVPVMQLRSLPEIDPAVRVRDDLVTTLDADGETESARSLIDLLRAGPAPFEFQPVSPRLAELATVEKDPTRLAAMREEEDYVDLLHTNSLQLFGRRDVAGDDALHRPDSLLVTLRHQDRIAVVGLESPELRWSWGDGELEGPHDATWLDDGNVLVFDNGLARGWSRVIEIDPTTDSVVWEYRAPVRERFHSATRGSAQRLANGNTLVTNSEAGQAFEVSSAGVVVWEYWNPSFTDRGRRRLIGTMTRLDPDLVEPLIERFAAGDATGDGP